MNSSSSVHFVNDEQSRLLLDSVNRHMILDAAEQPRSVKELVDTTRLNFGNVHYRVRKLLAAGLLEIDSVTKRKGRAIKHYRAISKAFLLKGVQVQDPLRNILTRVCETIEEEDASMSGIWIGLTDSGERLMKRVGDENNKRQSFQVCRQLYLTKEDHNNFRQELEALLVRYHGKSGTGRNQTPFTLWAGLAKGRLRDS